MLLKALIEQVIEHDFGVIAICILFFAIFKNLYILCLCLNKADFFILTM